MNIDKRELTLFSAYLVIAVMFFPTALSIDAATGEGITDAEIIKILPQTPQSTTLELTLNIDPNVTLVGGQVNVSGHVELSNGTVIANHPLYMWLNDTLVPGFGGWLHSRQVTLTELSGSDLEDYQVRLFLDTEELISGGKMRGDCGDIYFLNANQNALPYWLQSGCNTSNTTLWVKTNLTANSNNTIYLLYGNENASNESNGTATFILFDDFDGTSLDLGKWEIVNSNCFTVSGGKLHCSGNSAYPAIRTVNYVGSAGQSLATTVNMTVNSLGGSAFNGFLIQYNPSDDRVGWYAESISWDRWVCFQGSCSWKPGVNRGMALGDFIETVIFEPDRITQSVNGSTRYFDDSWSGTTTNEGKKLLLFFTYSGYSIDVYWVYVRNYVQDEPSVFIGSEETLIFINSSGDYSFSFSAPSEPGLYELKVNTTYQGIYGENTSELLVKGPPVIEDVSWSPFYPKGSDDVSVSTGIVDVDGFVVDAGLHYSYDGEVWSSTPMSNVSDNYSAIIHASNNTTETFFYVSMVDDEGFASNSSQFSFWFDAEPPLIHALWFDPFYPDAFDEVTVYANVTDNLGLLNVSLSYSYDGINFTQVVMNEENGIYSGLIPAANETTLVYYGVAAFDLAGHVNETETKAYYTAEVDFELTDLTVAGVLGGGLPVQFNATVRNNGPGDVLAAYHMGFTINGVFLGSIVDSNLLANDSKSYVYNWTAEPGDFILQAKADYQDYYGELNESNNFQQTSFRVMGPELHPLELGYSPSGFVDGGTVESWTLVENSGLTNASTFAVGFYVDNTLAASTVVSSLAVGESVNASANWMAWPGIENLSAVVDFGGAVGEENESNNNLTIQLPVVGFPDLIIENVSYTPESFLYGESVSFNVSILNIGDSTIRSFDVGFSTGESYVPAGVVSGLDADASASIVYNHSSSYCSFSASFYADLLNVVSESDELNNVYNSSLSSADCPDLSAAYLFWEPQSPTAGDDVLVSVTVSNSGPDVDIDFPVYFYVDEDLFASKAVYGLEGYSSLNVSSTWSAVGGLHQLKAVVDPLNVVGEVGEENNDVASAIDVVPLPDLAVSAWDVNVTYNSVSAVVRNLGAGNASGILVQFFDGGPGGVFIDEFTVNLSAGENVSLSTDYFIPDSSQNLSWWVDSQDAVPESSEDNNLAYYLIHNVSLSPAALNTSVGGEAAFTLNVSNPSVRSDVFNLSVSGVESSWLSYPSSVTVSAGQRASVPVTVSVPDDCGLDGIYSLEAFAVSANTNLSRSSSAELQVFLDPFVSASSPLNGSNLSSDDVFFDWVSSSSTLGTLYLKSENDSNYSVFEDSVSLSHSILVENLSRNKDYLYVMESLGICGAVNASGVFSIDNGVYFTERNYLFAVERDYDQRRSVVVVNGDVVAHTVDVSVVNPYNDLIVGFVGGGADAPLTLAPGQSYTLTLVFHAQDAIQEDYDLPISLTDVSENLSDVAHVNVSVRFPVVNISLEEVAFNNATLAYSFNVSNLGEPISDFSIVSKENLSGISLFSPAISHFNLESGSYLSFDVVPLLPEPSGAGGDPFTGGGSFSWTGGASGPGGGGDAGGAFHDVLFDCSGGRGVFEGHVECVTTCQVTKTWYCQNRPDIYINITSPPFADQSEISFSFLSIDFGEGYVGRSVTVRFNGAVVGQISGVTPSGTYFFKVNPSLINVNPFGPAVNELHIHTEDMNPGHYVTTGTVTFHLGLRNVEAPVCSASQGEADGDLEDLLSGFICHRECGDKFCVDGDGDGFGWGPDCISFDCDDGNPSIHPGAFDVCGNGVDEDCDGVDASCCGNFACESGAGETCVSCRIDCGSCGGCGNGVCDGVDHPWETCDNCREDCGRCSFCGNSLPDAGEDCFSCPEDVGACSSCGDGSCDSLESCYSCPLDCGVCGGCGDGQCTYAYESCYTCHEDCGVCNTCNNGIWDTGEEGIDCGGSCPACETADYKVLVVMTYYQDEDITDIAQYEDDVLQKLNETKEYYLQQSYGEDTIEFSEPWYIQLGPSGDYPDGITDDGGLGTGADFYSPPSNYGEDILTGFGQDFYGQYDAILAVQSDIQAPIDPIGNSPFRAVAYSERWVGWSDWVSLFGLPKPVACVNIHTITGTFSHELGHALYELDDFYGEPDNRGDIGDWGLMGSGNYLEPVAPLCSFNKVEAGWLGYTTSSESNLVPNKTFSLTPIGDLAYGDNVEKIENIGDTWIPDLTTYDYILEARKDRKGVVVYKDIHTWGNDWDLTKSYLEKLHPQLSQASGPTLNNDSPIYVDEIACLEFSCVGEGQCMSEGNPNQNVLVRYNPEANANLKGVILRNQIVFENNNSSNSSPTSPPLPRTGWSGFASIQPVNASLNSGGDLKVVFVNNDSDSKRVNSLNITSLDADFNPYRECELSGEIPKILRPREQFNVTGRNCTPLKKYRMHYFKVKIVSDSLHENGSIRFGDNVTYGTMGVVNLGLKNMFPYYSEETIKTKWKEKKAAEKWAQILLITAILWLVVVWLHTKSKKAIIKWIILFILAILFGLFAAQLANSEPPKPTESGKRGFSVVYPINTTVTESGEVEVFLKNDAGTKVRINSILITTENNKKCNLSIDSPLVVSPGVVLNFSVYDCAPREHLETGRYGTLYYDIDIMYDDLYYNDTIRTSNHSSRGTVWVVNPEITKKEKERETSKNITLTLIFAVALSWLGVVWRSTKNKKAVVYWVLFYLFVLFLVYLLANIGYASSSSLEPLSSKAPRIEGFDLVRVLGFTLEEDDTFIYVLSNKGNFSAQVKSIRVVNSLTQEECALETQLPITMGPSESTSRTSNRIYASGCGIKDQEVEWVEFDIEILFDFLSEDGKAIQKDQASKGKIGFEPDYIIEKQKKSTTRKTTLFFVSIFAVALLWFTIVWRSTKSKKKVLLWILWILLFLVLLHILLTPTYFAYLLTSALVKSSAGLPEPVDIIHPNLDYHVVTATGLSEPVDLTFPDLDLHAYSVDGLHVGMNYSSGLYERQIPGASASGDLRAEEWIFVPNDVNVTFYVDSRDVQQYLNESGSNETLELNYSVYTMDYGPNPWVELVGGEVVIHDRNVSEPTQHSIGPGETMAFVLPHCGDNITQDTTLIGGLADCEGDGLVIGADDIVFNCNGYLIYGDGVGEDYGLYLDGRENVTFTDCAVQEFDKGIYLFNGSNHNYVIGCQFTGNYGYGIYFEDSQYNTLWDNRFHNNTV
ncbi:MAG: DUF2341 domain-containing protein, partial [Candidatus Altiarchaeota archaeon]